MGHAGPHVLRTTMNLRLDVPLPTSPRDLDVRAAGLRESVLRTHAAAGGGHLGGSLSVVEILTALLGGPLDTSGWGEDTIAGDRLLLSKGHAALALYCAFAQIGLLEPTTLSSFGKSGAALEPHPNETQIRCVHASTGSLGQGLSIGLGLAYGSRLGGRMHERVAVVLGDGELNEGQIWEAAQAAPKLRLGGLLAVIDANGFQQDGPMKQIMPVANAAAAFSSLGWRVTEADGHDAPALAALFEQLLPARETTGNGIPALVIAHTIKGRGVPHLENETSSHYPPPLTAEDFAVLASASRYGSRP